MKSLVEYITERSLGSRMKLHLNAIKHFQNIVSKIYEHPSKCKDWFDEDGHVDFRAINAASAETFIALYKACEENQIVPIWAGVNIDGEFYEVFMDIKTGTPFYFDGDDRKDLTLDTKVKLLSKVQNPDVKIRDLDYDDPKKRRAELESFRTETLKAREIEGEERRKRIESRK